MCGSRFGVDVRRNVYALEAATHGDGDFETPEGATTRAS
jgi:hypothetical protein